MGENGFAEKVDWIKLSLGVMEKAATDSDDQNCGSAQKFIADLFEKTEEWMEAHYGDQQ